MNKNFFITFILLFLGIFLIGVIMYLTNFDIPKFIELLGNISLKMLLFWAFLEFIEFILHVIRFEVISESKKSFLDISISYNLGQLVSFLSPSRAVGEGVRVVVLKKYLGLNNSKSLSSVTIERVFDFIILCVALTGVLFLFSDVLVPVFIFLFVFALLFVLRSSRVQKFILNLIPFIKIKKLMEEYFKQTYTFTRDTPKTVKVVLLSLFIWIINFYRFWSILNYIGINIAYSLLSGIGAISYFAMVVSIFPGGMGFFEGVSTGSFALLGYDSSLVLSGIFIERIFSFWLIVISGIFVYLIKLYYK